jgi:hypothetical protein
MPEVKCWADGSYKWDMWSLAAMICEADMAKDAYVHINFEKDTLKAIREHTSKGITCPRLVQIMGEIIFKKKEENIMSMEELKKELARTKF